MSINTKNSWEVDYFIDSLESLEQSTDFKIAVDNVKKISVPDHKWNMISLLMSMGMSELEGMANLPEDFKEKMDELKNLLSTDKLHYSDIGGEDERFEPHKQEQALIILKQFMDGDFDKYYKTNVWKYKAALNRIILDNAA